MTTISTPSTSTTRPSRRPLIIAGLLVAIAAAIGIPLGLAAGGPSALDKQLARVKAANAGYAAVSAAAPTYQKFLTCMSSSTGGMGQHYVDGNAVGDASENPLHPEALVYQEQPNGSQQLAAVEYVVPAAKVNPASPPALFGQTFHPVTIPTVGKLYVLHVWLWKKNPAGEFKDWNPAVPACPKSAAMK